MTDAELIESVSGLTKAGPERSQAMIDACRRIDRENIPGDIVECGVWRGGQIILARKVAPSRVCWLYDTFSGMTEPGPYDAKADGRVVAAGKSAVSVQDVGRFLSEAGVFDPHKLWFAAGDVCETLRGTNLPDQIALLRLDTDYYESTKVELEVLWPRLSRGGILIIDDYGHWPGCRKAVDEYFKGRVRLKKIDYTAVMVVKE